MLLLKNHTHPQAGTIRDLLAAGAVADTWAPDGSSALMQAAAADAALVVEALLYEGGARVELQDALGRWAGAPGFVQGMYPDAKRGPCCAVRCRQPSPCASCPLLG